MSVTFCGHGSEIYDNNIRNILMQEIEKAVNSGENEFLFGGYGNFDMLAAHVVKDIKNSYPQIRLILVIPYLSMSFDADIYDESVYPPLEKVPRKLAIIKRNEWMIDKSNTVIAFVKHNWGGAAMTMEYAVKKKKNVINIIKNLKNP